LRSINVYLVGLFDEIAVYSKNILQIDRFGLLLWVTLRESTCGP